MSLDRKTPHYLTSITVQKAKNLAYNGEYPGNPFVVLDVMGSRKNTSYRFRTSNPVWDERLDVVTDFRPISATLTVLDYVNDAVHQKIGSAAIKLSETGEDVQTMSSPLSKEDVAGNLQKQGEIEYQLAFKSIPKERRHHYSWTGILHVDVDKIEGLPLYAQCLPKGSELVLRADLGAQKFAAVFAGGDTKKLDASGFLFVDTVSMKNDKIRFSLFSDDGRGNSEIIGIGHLSLNAPFDVENKVVMHDLLLAHSDNNDKPIGKLRLLTRLIPRSSIEEKIFDDLFDEYDYDFDGRIDKEEAFDLLATLHPTRDLSATRRTVERLFGARPFVAREAFLPFLRSTELHRAPLLNLLAAAGLRGRCFPSTAHLLRGFSYPAAAGAPRVRVFDRRRGTVFEEEVPSYVTLAMNAMRKADGDEETAAMARQLLPRLTARQGHHFDSKLSKTEIVPFMALHAIKMESLDRPLGAFKSFNDFFARGVNPAHRPLPSSPATTAVCPADCRLLAFRSIPAADAALVKGGGLNLRALLCNEALSARYLDGPLVVCRLAPRDPHRWAAPVDGAQGVSFAVAGGPGDQHPAHPLCGGHERLRLNSRRVAEIASAAFGSVLLVAVGGPMVNSVALDAAPGAELRRGDAHGHFAFGGSTLLLLFRKGRAAVDGDLLQRSERGEESFVRRNERIAVAVGAGAVLM